MFGRELIRAHWGILIVHQCLTELTYFGVVAQDSINAECVLWEHLGPVCTITLAGPNPCLSLKVYQSISKVHRIKLTGELNLGSSVLAVPHGCGTALIHRRFLRWEKVELTLYVFPASPTFTKILCVGACSFFSN